MHCQIIPSFTSEHQETCILSNKINYRNTAVSQLGSKKSHSTVCINIKTLFSFRAGYINYTIALNLTKYTSQEEEYVPWAAVQNNVGFIESILPRSSPAYKYLEVCKQTTKTRN